MGLAITDRKRPGVRSRVKSSDGLEQNHVFQAATPASSPASGVSLSAAYASSVSEKMQRLHRPL